MFLGLLKAEEAAAAVAELFLEVLDDPATASWASSHRLT